MRLRVFCAVFICSQFVFSIGGSGLKATEGFKPEVLRLNRRLLAANSSGDVDADCSDCGYTPDAPAPVSGAGIPRCKDVLCLVQGLLDRKSLIYVEHDIDISGSGALPDVTSEVTIMGTCIDGSPCRIDARGNSQIFVVGLNGYLTLKDLEITGASCQRGSAVTVSGSGSNDPGKGGKFVALNVRFTNNVASEFGGALYVESGGIAYLRDCIFRSNKAVKGGAIFVGSSKDFPAGGPNGTETDGDSGPVTCALNSCSTFLGNEFIRNSADFGGAVFVDDAASDCKDNGGAKFDCTACSFRENSAEGDGGAVFVNFKSSGAIAYFRRTRFTANTAKNYGGDVATQEGQYGTRGAQLYAYQAVFSGSSASKGSSVAVKPFSFSTFARCGFSSGSSLQCEGSCDTFCPSSAPLSNGSSAYGQSGESCPVSPSPLCSWIPDECKQSPSSQPPPSSPPPSTPSQTPPSSPPPSTPSQSPPSSPPPLSPPLSPPPPSSTPTVSPPPPAEEPATPPTSSGQDPWFRAKRPPPTPPSPPPESFPPRSSPPPESASPPPESLPPPESTPPPSSHGKVSGRHRHHNGSITGDPHFVGKHGERFDFHGKGGRDYCIVSDKDLHVNMHVFRGLHRHSTFISKIGVLFRSNRVLIEAQAKKSASHFEDQWNILVNKIELPKHQTRETDDGLKITSSARSVQIRMQNELDVNVTVMPPSFGKFGSGSNYLDFQINQLKVSSSVHGVLGQTYQETLATYRKIQEAKARRLKRTRAASLFMDGSENDYLSSGIMTPDCKYSAYIDQSRISKRIQRMVLESAQSLLRLSKPDETVRQCTGFGHSLCLELEDD